MILYGVRRLALAVPLLLGMSVLIFALMRLVPGDPAVAVLGYKATPEGVAALREAFHLDEPVPRQYLRWLGAAARGDLGHDFRQSRCSAPVDQDVRAGGGQAMRDRAPEAATAPPGNATSPATAMKVM